ncbi:cold-regulated protein 27 isoform X2 [Lycium barbarum]|uniref:cold-regulated protein 27 isoform X2 n=1 Tax=Lycium barbarum TaxID=112863 RepID=UPI00293F150C|nr:cold-regulated protein 27 isoform X2 [Lycium barbarum]
MEESYRRCGNELTRSSSGASSLSVANSKHTFFQTGNATTIYVGRIAREDTSVGVERKEGVHNCIDSTEFLLMDAAEAGDEVLACQNKEITKMLFVTMVHRAVYTSTVVDDKYTGWTNEKHNTFLDCLEASFIKQLHRSMALRAGSVELNKSCSDLSEKSTAHVNKASEQLPFLHDGCWKKIKTVRKPPAVHIAANSHDSLKFLRCDGHHHVLDCQFCCELDCKGKRTRDERSSSRGHETRSQLILPKPAELQKTVCRLTEGSGQNFVNEDFDENSRCKKMKTASVETADQEQIVPTRNMGVQELLVPCSRVTTK